METIIAQRETDQVYVNIRNNQCNYTCLDYLVDRKHAVWLLSKTSQRAKTILSLRWRKPASPQSVQSTNPIRMHEISETWLPSKNSWDNAPIASVNNGTGTTLSLASLVEIRATRCAREIVQFRGNPLKRVNRSRRFIINWLFNRWRNTIYF